MAADGLRMNEVSANPGQRSQAQMVVVEDLIVLYGGICNPQERGDCVDGAMYIFHIESKQWLQVDCASAAVDAAREAAKLAKGEGESGGGGGGGGDGDGDGDGDDGEDDGQEEDAVDAALSDALVIARKLQPPGRCGHSMSVWRNHTIVVFGGYSEEGYYGDTWCEGRGGRGQPLRS